MRFYFFRHAEAVDGKITPAGIETASRVARKSLSSRPISRVFVTFMERTRRTAEVMLAAAGIVSPKFQKLQSLDSEDDDYSKDLEPRNFADSDEILVIGHFDELEHTIRKLINSKEYLEIENFKHCEGAIVDYDGEKFTLVEELRRS